MTCNSTASVDKQTYIEHLDSGKFKSRYGQISFIPKMTQTSWMQKFKCSRVTNPQVFAMAEKQLRNQYVVAAENPETRQLSFTYR